MSNLFMVLAGNASEICDAIPSEITDVTQMLYTIIKIAIPVILIVYGMLDFGKSVMAGKEDEIKANQKLFLKRLIAAALVFFVFSIVQILLNMLEIDEGIIGCMSKILG